MTRRKPAPRLSMVSLFLGALVVAAGAAPALATTFQYQGNFGSPTLTSPWGGTRDSAGNFYVADLSTPPSVAVFNSSGTFTMHIGGGTLVSVTNLTAAPNNCLYVLDNGAVRKFDAAHNSAGTFGALSSPYGIAADSAADIFVADTGNNRILKFDAAGNPLLTIAPTGAGAFNHPYGVALDSLGQIYVADSFNNRIQIFASNGSFLRQFSSTVPAWSFDHPVELAVGPDGRIFVTEDSGLAAFSSTGTLLDTYGGSGQFSIPTSVLTDGTNLWCVDRAPSGTSGHDFVQVFTVPEPASLSLLALGIAALLAKRTVPRSR